MPVSYQRQVSVKEKLLHSSHPQPTTYLGCVVLNKFSNSSVLRFPNL